MMKHWYYFNILITFKKDGEEKTVKREGVTSVLPRRINQFTFNRLIATIATKIMEEFDLKDPKDVLHADVVSLCYLGEMTDEEWKADHDLDLATDGSSQPVE